MNYRNVGKSGLKVSEIAVGSWMTDLVIRLNLHTKMVLIFLIVLMLTAAAKLRSF